MIVGSISSGERVLFHFLSLVTRQSAALIFATPHGMSRNGEGVSQRILEQAFLCISCYMRNTAQSLKKCSHQNREKEPTVKTFRGTQRHLS